LETVQDRNTVTVKDW